MITPKVLCSAIMEASNTEDKKYIRTMDKHEVHQLNGQAVQTLYELSMKVSGVDFGTIPKSAGDFEKCEYYENVKKCLDVLRELYTKNNITDKTLDTVKLAVSNIIQLKQLFMNGFRTKHEYVMLMYDAIALAIVESTSLLIRSYVNYIMSADREYSLTMNDKNRSLIAVQSLETFNQGCENGNIAQSLKYMTESKVKNFIGEEVAITGVVLLALTAIVPLIRELIYFYYHSRVKLSDYLKTQADFLEMNKLAVEASNRPPKERKQIVAKQDKMVKDLRRTADKIYIDQVDTNDIVKRQIKDESSMFSLSAMSQQLNKNKLEGNDLKIL